MRRRLPRLGKLLESIADRHAFVFYTSNRFGELSKATFQAVAQVIHVTTQRLNRGFPPKGFESEIVGGKASRASSNHLVVIESFLYRSARVESV